MKTGFWGNADSLTNLKWDLSLEVIVGHTRLQVMTKHALITNWGGALFLQIVSSGYHE